MPTSNLGPGALDEETVGFYRDVLRVLTASKVPFLVGGAYGFERYTGIARHTKDLDVFVRPRDCENALHALAGAGYRTELTFPHWLGKAFCGSSFIDIIFSGGNGVADVDAGWFEHAEEEEVLGIPVKLCPPEEMIWQKAFIMERERYDGADVAHVLRARATRMDWPRLLDRFGPYWRVLLSHLVLFGFIYPNERSLIPHGVMCELLRRLEEEMASAAPSRKICQGTLLSRAQYLDDLEKGGLEDARVAPIGNVTEEEVARWTAAIGDEQRKLNGDEE